MRRGRRAWLGSSLRPLDRLRPVGHVLAVACGLLATTCLAQQISTPQLLRRHLRADAEESSGDFRPGRTGLPDEASGSYALNPDGNEVIELILNGSGGETRLQGYLTRVGDGPSDRGASLTFFFTRTTVSPRQMTFLTRQVHGVWWSFAGTVDRGSAQVSTQKGYYYLNGTLTEHFDSGQSQGQRVSLPLLPSGGSQ